MISFYLRAVDRFSRAAWVMAQVLIALAIAICCANALSRKLLDLSSNAFLEAQWYCFGAAFLLAGSQAMADNAHVRIDILAGRLSERRRLQIDLAGLLGCVIPFCLLMTVWSWPMFADAFARQEMSADAGGLLRWPIKLMIPLGFLLLTLQAGSQVIYTLERMKNLAATGNRAEHA